jgi:hypothetical protein
MTWTILSTAPNQLTAESWCEILTNNGFNCKVEPGDFYSFMGISNSPVRILIVDKEFDSAKQFLSKLLI